MSLRQPLVKPFVLDTSFDGGAVSFEDSAEPKSLESSTIQRSTSRQSNSSSSNADNRNYVRLNVGGCNFETTRTTLLTEPDSIFHALFSGRFPLTLDDQGRIFLDRDGLSFEFILNYLRTGSCLLSDIGTIQKLRLEAKYFQMTGLKTLLNERLDELQVEPPKPGMLQKDVMKMLNQNPKNLQLPSANLFGLDLSGIIAQQANFRFTLFTNGTLESADFKGASMHGANLSGTRASGLNLEGAACPEATFFGAELVNACLKGADLRNTNFREANLENANFEGANLINANFQGANLRNSSLVGAKLQGTSFMGVNNVQFAKGVRR